MRLGRLSPNEGLVMAMSSAPLPALLDAKQLRAELGVTRAAAEAIMRQVPAVQIQGTAENVLSAAHDVER